jgi:hypothetical protein
MYGICVQADISCCCTSPPGPHITDNIIGQLWPVRYRGEEMGWGGGGERYGTLLEPLALFKSVLLIRIMLMRMQIRILLVTLMRVWIRILPFSLMQIRILASK